MGRSLVTDEMVERALDAAGRGSGELGPCRMRAAMEAALDSCQERPAAKSGTKTTEERISALARAGEELCEAVRGNDAERVRTALDAWDVVMQDEFMHALDEMERTG